MTTTSTQALATQPKRRSGGAPAGNRNGCRHGLRGAALPRGCERVGREINLFRRALETAVLDARGEITLVDASLINTAYRAERHAQLSQRWLGKEAHDMTPADRLNYSREVVRASESRDKAIDALNLPKRSDDDPWRTLTHQTNGHATQSLEAKAGSPKSSDASTGRTGDVAKCGQDGPPEPGEPK
jgi:hypothetical protein